SRRIAPASCRSSTFTIRLRSSFTRFARGSSSRAPPGVAPPLFTRWPRDHGLHYLLVDRRTRPAHTLELVMNTADGLLVPVRCAWNAWQTAEVRLSDLHDVHWLQPMGAPRPLVHAYVDCTATAGLIAHDCRATPAPHRLLVWVLKGRAAPLVYQGLVRLAEIVHPLTMPAEDVARHGHSRV